MSNNAEGFQEDERLIDRPRSIAAIFKTEAQGLDALERLHEAGFKKAWMGIVTAPENGAAFSEVVRARGGGRLEEFTRIFGAGWDQSLYAALTDHGVADDVARRLQMSDGGVVVVAGWTGDMRTAAEVLAEAGGDVQRGADKGVIGTARLRLPSE